MSNSHRQSKRWNSGSKASNKSLLVSSPTDIIHRSYSISEQEQEIKLLKESATKRENELQSQLRQAREQFATADAERQACTAELTVFRQEKQSRPTPTSVGWTVISFFEFRHHLWVLVAPKNEVSINDPCLFF